MTWFWCITTAGPVVCSSTEMIIGELAKRVCTNETIGISIIWSVRPASTIYEKLDLLLLSNTLQFRYAAYSGTFQLSLRYFQNIFILPRTVLRRAYKRKTRKWVWSFYKSSSALQTNGIWYISWSVIAFNKSRDALFKTLFHAGATKRYHSHGSGDVTITNLRKFSLSPILQCNLVRTAFCFLFCLLPWTRKSDKRLWYNFFCFGGNQRTPAS